MTRKNLKHMYAMTGVNMGDRPSGTIAIVSLCKTAEMSSDEFPCSCETILKKSYMDDISESVKTREEALTLTSEIDKILEHDSLRIKGWATPRVGREIGQEAHANTRTMKISISHEVCSAQVMMPWNWKECLVWVGTRQTSN